MALILPAVGDSMVVARDNHGAAGFTAVGQIVTVVDLLDARVDYAPSTCIVNNGDQDFHIFLRSLDPADENGNAIPRPLTVADFPVGTYVMAKGESLSHYGLSAGTHGIVTDVESDEVRVRFERAPGDDVSIWVYLRQIDRLDMSTVTDPDLWKRVAVRRLFEHKEENGWCGTAEALAVQIGLGDYLPLPVDVTIPASVTVQRWPGENNAAVVRRTRSSVTPDTMQWGRAEVSDREQPYSAERGYDVDPTPEGESFEEYKGRVASTAMKGARAHGVSGVPDFLRAIGIDPDSVVETRTMYATVEVEVPVGATTDLRQFARDLFTLALPSDVTISDAWGA